MQLRGVHLRRGGELSNPIVGQFYFRTLAWLDLATAQYCSWRARHGARIRMDAQIAQWTYEDRLQPIRLDQVVRGKIRVAK